MAFVDINIIKQLKDAVTEVSRRKCNKSVAEIVSIELYFMKNTLMSWFNKKNQVPKSTDRHINKK